MHLVHTYIAYRVSISVCSVYRSSIIVCAAQAHLLVSVCADYAHRPANAVSCRVGVYSYISKI